MKKINYKYRIFSLINILTVLMLSTGCTDFETEIDLAIAKFPPKLCITAVLDGSDSTFIIVISEGRALADYKKSYLPEKENKRYGEIRLYEDDRRILTEAGEFDLRYCYMDEEIFTNLDYSGIRRGHRFKTTVATNPGSVYRLEVEVDGYKTAVSTSKMPQLPNVSASIDTTVVVRKNSIKQYSSLDIADTYFYPNNTLWPVTLQWGARENDRNYYALDMRLNRTLVEGIPISGWYNPSVENCGILVSELSKLQDNPEIEIYESQQIDFEGPSRGNDAYLFPILMMSDIGFSNDHTSLTLYKDTTRFLTRALSDGATKQNIYNNILTLRVRHITEATFNYYRSLAKQSTGVDFFTEPYIITGNIENGYGGFTVSSAVNFQLLEYQSTVFFDDYEAYPDY